MFVQYPSIMQAHNLCYSTLVRREHRHLLNSNDYAEGPAGHAFLKTEKQQGILPAILNELLTARKRVKALMAEEKKKGDEADKTTVAVYDGRQLALKVSANSVYGKPFFIHFSLNSLLRMVSRVLVRHHRLYWSTGTQNYTFERGSPSSMHTTRRSLLGQRYNPPFGKLYTAPCER